MKLLDLEVPKEPPRIAPVAAAEEMRLGKRTTVELTEFDAAEEPLLGMSSAAGLQVELQDLYVPSETRFGLSAKAPAFVPRGEAFWALLEQWRSRSFTFETVAAAQEPSEAGETWGGSGQAATPGGAVAPKVADNLPPASQFGPPDPSRPLEGEDPEKWARAQLESAETLEVDAALMELWEHPRCGSLAEVAEWFGLGLDEAQARRVRYASSRAAFKAFTGMEL